ncbi:hypothetical protein HPB47_025608 [Ixodes persulcatus]|uniref:Uncharacterized protein n=1 Tax=Ixodes persulcatus TaxID=34615 RepID=A0AC60Q2A1_IXOPE|nr:hypothetical protein HPB47_025608 [Ixodes persulcatus]
MHLTGRPVGKFDPEGLIFAVRLYLEPVELYDLRAFDRGPLNTFKLPRDKECDSERGGHPPHRRLPAGRRTAVCTCGAQRRAWGGLRTVVLNCDHTDPVHCYQFSPKYVMLVAACWTIWATTWPLPSVNLYKTLASSAPMFPMRIEILRGARICMKPPTRRDKHSLSSDSLRDCAGSQECSQNGTCGEAGPGAHHVSLGTKYP